MPARDVARILNNESNLKILDKLKTRPYYPRELAQEMELSEPFVVRRLKAMEEEDIVEGRWETEGTRKVKRYYLKDVKIEYGREGLKVSSEQLPPPPPAPAKPAIDVKKEMFARLLKLPLMIIFLAGILFNIQVILVLMLLFFVWYLAMTVGFYRRYHFKTTLLSIPVYIYSSIVIGGMIVSNALQMIIPIGAVLGLLAIALVYVMLYQARYYQLELDDLLEKNGEFIDGLDDEPGQVRLFYLPMALRWKISEYFKIV